MKYEEELKKKLSDPSTKVITIQRRLDTITCTILLYVLVEGLSYACCIVQYCYKKYVRKNFNQLKVLKRVLPPVTIY